jgi:hypothetical protein
LSSRQVLVFDIPTSATGVGMNDAKVMDFYAEATRRVAEMPGVDGVAMGMIVPWRDTATLGVGSPFAADSYKVAPGEERPRARFRVVSPRFFGVLGVPIVAGRDFTDDDRASDESVAIVSQSVAQRLFQNGDAVNRHVVDRSADGELRLGCRAASSAWSRIWTTGVVPAPALTIYQPVRQIGIAGRLFVHAGGDPRARPAVARVIREISPEQPVERAATLEDVRGRLSPSD